MSNHRRDFWRKDFVCLVLVLAAIAGLLVGIFTFLATVEIDEAVAFILFLLVSGLLIAGYAVGLMVLGWGAVVEFAKHINKPSKQDSVGGPP